MQDEKRKLKAARLGMIALFVANVMWVCILIYARHQREWMVDEFNKKLDEQIELSTKNDDLLEACMTRLKKCDEIIKEFKTQH